MARRRSRRSSPSASATPWSGSHDRRVGRSSRAPLRGHANPVARRRSPASLRSRPSFSWWRHGVGKTTPSASSPRAISRPASGRARRGRQNAAAVQQLEVWGKRIGASVISERGGRTRAPSPSTRRRRRAVKAAPTYLRRHGRPPPHEGPAHGRDQESAPHDREGLRRGAPRDAARPRRDDRSKRARPGAIFKQLLNLTGIVLTKLDGTAKGGIVLAICDELKVPVRYIGLGERAEDLREFGRISSWRRCSARGTRRSPLHERRMSGHMMNENVEKILREPHCLAEIAHDIVPRTFADSLIPKQF